MNIITIAGQLGKDAEMRYLPKGDPVAAFSVADSQGKDKPTIWWNCGLFGKRAESLAPYLVKGQAVTVTGQITEREWADKEGNKRKSLEVRVIDVALQGGKKTGPDLANNPAKAQPANPGRFADMPDDDIPF